MQQAVVSSSASLQVDALQLAAVHPKAISLPGKIAVHFLRCYSSAHNVSCCTTTKCMQRGVANSSKSLQVDALQLACVVPKATSLPGKISMHTLSCCLDAETECTLVMHD